ncbi:putative bifunctional diguanylate cyclase/phosphodiesterase [Rhodococcus sp. LB1]|uniref:putative bifunctional diguanylate cyclase/phosphodiesterase n=1 Tax=Rhodococcus sp. LB1 TaxID=1807499 RepID=UPI0007C64C33|nr:EAL domain-containing protein [Rhodococcus sp. LB1]
MVEVEFPEALARSLLVHAPDLVSVSELVTGRIVYLNPAGRGLVGLRDDADARARTTAEFFTDAGLAQAGLVEAALTAGGRWRGVSELRHFGTGAAIPVSISTFVLPRPEDGPALIAAVMRDLRPRRRQEHRLRRALEGAAYRAREQQALAELSQLAVHADRDELLTAATGAAATLMGVQCASISQLTESGDTLEVLAYRGQPPQPRSFPTGTASHPGYAVSTGEMVVCPNRDRETRFDTAAMAARRLRSGICVPIGNGADWGVLAVHSPRSRDYTDRDISFLRAVAAVVGAAIRRIDAETRLRHRSMQDPLTGLPNRLAAYHRIDTALDTAREQHSTFALLLVDLDDFKTVNDILGHSHGDAALIHLGARLTGAVRPADTVARLGGDEFLIICEHLGDIPSATALATRIIALLATRDDLAPTAAFSASIGIAISEPTCTVDELIRRADLAMYRAKRAGPGSYAVYDRAGDAYDANRVVRLSTDLRVALENPHGQLTLLYQPIVDLHRGGIVAVEALARWTHPALGVIDPTEFVAVAERTGLIDALFQWVLRTACRHAAPWQRFGVDLRVNVTGTQLQDPVFADRVAAALTATGMPADRLGLEITDTTSGAVPTRSVDTLAGLQQRGVALLLDGLGPGHNPLAGLDRYPMFDYLKIDRAHVTALPGRRPEAVVTAIVALAHAVDARVIAVGVENQTQLDILRAHRCDLAQGFHLADPAPADTITTLLEHPRPTPDPGAPGDRAPR